MKKFFGVVGLIFCVFLASCNFNGFSDKSGSLEFSISKNDIALLANQHAAREGAGDESKISEELLVFVQIKGSKGYYAYKSQTVGIEFKKIAQEGSSDANFDYAQDSMLFYYEALKDVDMTFEQVPVNQTYTVMFDLLVKPLTSPSLTLSYHICSGKTKNVVVTADQTNQVDVTASTDPQPLVLLKVEYADGSDPVISDFDTEDGNSYGLMLNKKDGKLYQSKYNAESTTPVRKEIKDISFVLSEDSNFADSWVKYTLNYSGFNYDDPSVATSENTLLKTDLSFKKGAYSLKDLILQYTTFSSAYFTVDSNGFSFEIDSPYFYLHPAYDWQEDPTEENVFSQEKHGSLLNTSSSVSESGEVINPTIVFSKRNDSNRYIYSVSLKNALEGKTLSDGDTVVFVMKVLSPTNKPVTFNQFYYELQTEKWGELDDDVLYDGNECINVDDSSVPSVGYYTFVMPLNFIEDSEDYNTVLFFYDGQAGSTTEDTQTLTVSSLDYYIFPASSKSFVFGLGKNWDDSTNQVCPYRYEFNKPLVDADGKSLTLAGGETVSVTINGNVKGFSAASSSSGSSGYNSSTYFGGEIYDGVEYTSIKDEWLNFHPLSNTEGTHASENIPRLTISDGEFSNSGTYKFVDIQEPYFDKANASEKPTPAHNYMFQCASTCPDPTVLLVIEGFEMATTVSTPN